MTALAAWATLCGLALGLGLWLLVSLAPRLSRPSLSQRLAPHVIDVSREARDLLDRTTANPLPVFGIVFAPVTGRIHRAIVALLGGGDVIRRRLRQAGSSTTVEAFRSGQLMWAAVAAAAGIVVSFALSGTRSLPVSTGAAIVLVAIAAGFVGRGYLLRRAAASRVARMTKELPTVLEFMTLSLSAGEGVLDAIRRVTRISRGELAAEFGSVVAEVNTGLPLADSLLRMASQLQLPSLSRAIEQITGALERGTPIAEVLRAQAQDARDDAKRELLEISGKKEVAMLVPLVFLILPLTVVIAIFPGIYVLQLGF